jgi:hypothetical protein
MAVAVNVDVTSVLTCKKEKYELEGLKEVTKVAVMVPKDLMPIMTNLLHKTKVSLIPVRRHKMALYACCTICPAKYNGKQFRRVVILHYFSLPLLF